MAVFSQGYEIRFANFYQRLSQKKESQAAAVPATISQPAVFRAHEWRAVAAQGRAGLLDAAGDTLERGLVLDHEVEWEDVVELHVLRVYLKELTPGVSPVASLVLPH